ncbi:hypothetical protein, conserved [Plasmodium vivax]|uniref:VIR protein n=1 Tax=Plasmodium vivax TaxID=5855 RepID=A0A1G4EDR1_PLAVI|nr:hypothetical protein, conserved [Plasmodium vivax]
MGDSKSYDTFLNYHDYDEYQYHFNRIPDSDFNEQVYQKSIDLLDDHKNLKNTYSDSFRLLFKHIHNGHVFTSMDLTKACKYISYALRKKVYREKQQEYNDTIFDMFKKFVTKYKKAEHITSDHCEKSLVLIDPEIFEKMRNLYTLYEEYAVFAPTTGYYRQPNITCPELKRFSILYNAFIKDQNPTNKYHYDVLKNFEQKVTNTINNNKNKCSAENLSTVPLKEYYLQEEVKSNIVAQEKQQPKQISPEQIRSPISEQAVHSNTSSQISKDRTALHTQPEMDEDREAVRLGKPERGQEHQEVEVAERAEEARGTENVYRGGHGTEDVYRASRSPQMPRSSGYPGDITIPETLKHTRLTDNSLDTQKTESPIEDSGFFTNVQGAFSSIAQHVEPAPILGVYGGMGVLFLLFKYTPVGSFFGGRRGRIRQIPSSFRGFPPGEFPNFHEYDGGYIGYGPMNINPLAE